MCVCVGASETGCVAKRRCCELLLLPFIPSVCHPSLDPVCGTVLSLVISSHFLQMKVLYDECVEFFRSNLQAIVSSPVDTACLPPAICAHIAGPIPDSSLVALEV